MAATFAPADPLPLSRRLLLPSRLPATPLLRHRRPRLVAMAAEPGGENSKPRVLVAEKLGRGGVDLLKGLADVDCAYNLSPEELRAKIGLCDALIVRSGTKVDRDVFEASGGSSGAPGSGSTMWTSPPPPNMAAEHGIALLTAMARNIARSDASMKSGKWERNKYVGVSLVGKTLAILGFGKVGSEVARRAKGLGLHVIAHDPYAAADRAHAIGVDLVTFDEAIARADFISLHMPLTPSTSKILNDEAFAKMKKGVRIINVARGGVLDEEALVKALDSGVVAQAALDVFTKEPPSADNKLVLHEKVTATPHLGASTVEAQEEVAIEIAEAVLGALKGELASTSVNAPMVPAEVLSELTPFVLGRLVVQLVAGGSGVKSVKVTYTIAITRGDLDTRLLRAMITKGLIEPISDVHVNIVNADFTAKQRGIRITEERILLDGHSPFD
ncbi:D-3-phosphoglycerate dehydrogenase [Musa troglodytarum]|uniref:phosphoglycerate dehydrogenase n=1 Tax=Musa troglodytarum TaxID=320322 RepID=A0A9E7FTH2_9LILI|nr:D-3-phosphoglycerate dehydrogenase [Musa troglodytarum]